MRIALAILVAFVPFPAFAGSATVTLPVSFAGLPVGKLHYTVTIDGDRYTINGEGATGGVGRLASKASSTFRAQGKLGPDRAIPASHSVSYRDGKKEGSAAIKFRGGRIASVSETPPPTPRKDRVAVTPDMLAGAIDPTSALIVPASPDASLAAVCNRTIKVSDARNLFTLTLTPLKTGKLADGARAHTCAVRYRALGGHRASSKAVPRFERNKSLQITYSPVARDGSNVAWGIVGFAVKTRFGRVRATAKGVDEA